MIVSKSLGSLEDLLLLMQLPGWRSLLRLTKVILAGGSLRQHFLIRIQRLELRASDWRISVRSPEATRDWRLLGDRA